MNTLATIAELFRSRMTFLGRKQAQLRVEAGLSKQTLTNVLSGTSDYKVTTLLAVADRLGLAVVLVPKAAAAGLQGPANATAVRSLVDVVRERLNGFGQGAPSTGRDKKGRP